MRKYMPEFNSDILGQLKSMARNGETPSSILHQLVDLLPSGPAQKVALIKYMRAAFGLTLEDASPIAGWSSDNSGELKDARINELIAPAILATKAHWLID
jgi:hypothetical protein